MAGGRNTDLGFRRVVAVAVAVAVFLPALGLAATPTNPKANPPRLNFGPVVANTEETKTVTFTNRSDHPINLDSLEIVDSPDTFFTTEPTTCPDITKLGPGESCTISVEFAPFSEGRFSGQLITNWSNETVVTIPLTGRGVSS